MTSKIMYELIISPNSVNERDKLITVLLDIMEKDDLTFTANNYSVSIKFIEEESANELVETLRQKHNISADYAVDIVFI